MQALVCTHMKKPAMEGLAGFLIEASEIYSLIATSPRKV